MTAWVIVAAIVAGSLGAVARYAVTRVAAKLWPDRLTRAVLIVNVVGSVIAGAMLGLPGDARYIVLSGLCAGLTTFSTWSVETVQLMLDRKSAAAIGNVVLNLAAGVIGAVIGAVIGYAVTGLIVVSAGGGL